MISVKSRISFSKHSVISCCSGGVVVELVVMMLFLALRFGAVCCAGVGAGAGTGGGVVSGCWSGDGERRE